MSTILSNRYILQEIIGQGTMGIVYRAYDRLNQTTVAVKRIHVAVDTIQLGAQHARKTNLLALTREFYILSSLRHPHIISVLDYGIEEDQSPYFVMEHLADARKLDDACKPLSINGKVSLLIQVFEALAYLHQRGILHRDLKMDNVLVSNGYVQVLDFGLSIVSTQAQGRIGSIAYMAPETLQSSISVEASDLYSAGVMAYEIFAGVLPFEPQDVVGILSKPPDLSLLDVTPMIGSIIGRLLLKDPDDRYTSAEAVIKALQEATQRPVTFDKEAVRYKRHMLKTAFVGRDAELSTLHQALDELQVGQGSFWLIGGESGIGKTRLLAELRTYALVNDIQVLSGEINHGINLPYQIWRKIIPQLALSVDLTPQEAAILNELVPISHLNDYNHMPTAHADGEATQQRLIATMNAVIGRLEQPTILLLENLHWAEESLTILQQLALLVDKQRLAIIATYIPEEAPDLPDTFPQANYLILKPLDNTAVQDLVKLILGSDVQLLSLLKLIEQEAGGNPFSIIEMLRVLTQSDQSSEETTSFDLFTKGVDQMIITRLQRTPQHLIPILQLASVFGQKINIDLLEVHLEHNLTREWLMFATNSGILSVADNQWFFTHNKVRQASLSILSDDESSRLHLLAARAYERVYANDPVYTPFLIQHWRGAKDVKKVLHYARIAAKFSFDRGLSRQAQHFVEQALDIVDTTTDGQIIISMCLLLCDIHTRLGHYNEALDLYGMVKGLAIDHNDRKTQALVLAKMGWVLLRASNAKTAREHCLQAVEIAQEIRDPTVLSLALKNFGLIALRSGNLDEADRYLNRSLILVREIDAKQEIASILNSLGLTFMAKGYYHKASQYFAEGLKFFELLDDRWHIAVALHNYGACMASMGHYEIAEQHVRRSLELDRTINDMVGVAYHLSYLIYIALHRENFAEAEHYLAELEVILSNTSDNTLKGSMSRSAGWLYLYQGNMLKCREYFDQALVINQELGHTTVILVCKMGYGWMWLLQEEWAKAYQVFEENIAETYALKENWTLAETRNGMAFAQSMLGDYQHVLDYLKESIALAQVMDAKPLIVESIVVYALSIAHITPHHAAALIYFIMDNPAGRTIARRLVDIILSLLQKTLTQADLEAAQEQANQLEFDRVVEQIMQG